MCRFVAHLRPAAWSSQNKGERIVRLSRVAD